MERGLGNIAIGLFNITQVHTLLLIYMEDYEIIGWPEIQYFMDIEGFDDNATLIEENDAMGIDSSTYLVSKDWLKSLEE